MQELKEIFSSGGGEFLTSPEDIASKIDGVKAMIFDWDGVFYPGAKSENLLSTFSEADSMGSNMLRFGLWMNNGNKVPTASIISGAHNPTARSFAEREHFNSVFLRFLHKQEALDHFVKEYGIEPDSILYFFDDILDVPITKVAGIRIMIRREGSPLFTNYVKDNGLADYITGNTASQNGIREACELILGLKGIYTSTIDERVAFSENYKMYLEDRNSISTVYFEPGSTE